MDRNSPVRLSIQDARDDRSARACAGSVRITDATLPESHFRFGSVDDVNEFDVRSIRECWMSLEYRADLFDVRIVNRVDENRTVWIAGRASRDKERLASGIERVSYNLVCWRRGDERDVRRR